MPFEGDPYDDRDNEPATPTRAADKYRWWFAGLLGGLLIVLVLLELMAAARSAPPENADPALAPWFQSLTGRHGESCCSVADCRPADARLGESGGEVLIEGQWVPVPEDAVLHRDNPTGQAILCRDGYRVRCFVPPSET